jgi:hypothetical protein
VSARVGDEVQGVCRKCGVTWHVVIALVDGRIGLAECSQCGARHRHRPAERGGNASPRVRRPAAGSERARRGKRPLVEADPSRPCRPFRTSDTYRVGDRIAHATFGEGVVQAVVGARKIEALFETGPRILVHGRGGS